MLPNDSNEHKGAKRLVLCLAAVAALGATGCASDESPASDDELQGSGDDSLALQASGAAKTLPDPGGAYFAEVTANGTGCPAGSWDTNVSSDGKVFTTTFSRYIAELQSSQTSSTKDCTLRINLRSPAGLSFSVSEFFYQGYAFLEEGTQGFQSANYYFQGAPVLGVERGKRVDLVGPVDRTYNFRDAVPLNDAVWSPCGLERDLNVVTRLGVQSAARGSEGYINMSSIDGSLDTKLVVKLSWRSCSTTAAPTPTAPAPTAPTRPTRPTRPRF